MYVCVCVCVVQALSLVCLFETPWTVAHEAPLPSTLSQSLLKLMSVEPVMLLVCVPISSSYKNTSYSGLGATLMTSW